MEYEYFIGMIKQYETESIKAYSGNSICSATTQIPKPFGLLAQDIIAVLNQNIDKLCNEDEAITIIGLQPASVMPQSDNLKLRKRMFDACNVHYCCTLEYQVVAKNENIIQWERTRSLIVDFTTGDIMDKECYLARVTSKPNTGNIFGQINATLLDTAWQMTRIRHRDKLDQVA